MTDKQALRQRVWDTMEKRGFARFPRPVHHRIPNFVGSEKAAEVLAASEVWRSAKVLKANPDSAQQPVRERALREGKVLYMAVPKLASESPFVRVRGDEVAKPRYASTIQGALGVGRAVGIPEMDPVDLVVAGSVAVNLDGARLGKGGGFSDLEFALTRAYGVVSERTPVITTVHSCQILDEDIPMEAHDEPVDFVATPEKVHATTRRYSKPSGVDWSLLTEKQVQKIPLLRRLRAKAGQDR